MLIDIFNKILIFLFVLSLLNVVRHTYFVIQSWYLKERYVLSKSSLILFGISLAYVISGLISGITV